jgi:hypothetical protein
MSNFKVELPSYISSAWIAAEKASNNPSVAVNIFLIIYIFLIDFEEEHSLMKASLALVTKENIDIKHALILLFQCDLIEKVGLELASVDECKVLRSDNLDLKI